MLFNVSFECCLVWLALSGDTLVPNVPRGETSVRRDYPEYRHAVLIDFSRRKRRKERKTRLRGCVYV